MTVSVGIPAFNEEGNIGHLINNVLAQVQLDFKLERIIVASDGSTDKTNSIVRAIKDKRITLIENKERKGLGRGLNQIIEKTDSKVLILLDADIAIKDRFYIIKLIKPIAKNGKDLTSCRISEKIPCNFFEKSLYVSMRLKENLFETIRGGNNLFTCHGPARAFSRNLYKNLHFPEGKGNDMYSYLFTKANGFSYEYVKDCAVYYKLPQNLKDHREQSLRFFNSIDSQRDYFFDRIIQYETKISLMDYLVGAMKSTPLFLRYPMHIAYYALLNIYLKLSSLRSTEHDELWSMAKSSKNLQT